MKKYDEEFEASRRTSIQQLGSSSELKELSRTWMEKTAGLKYVYNFNWLNTPIIQFPQDIIAIQELIFEVEPDLIIETGVARGGSVLFSASMLALLDLRVSLKDKLAYERKRKVIGVDIDIRSHTKSALADEPIATYVDLVEGSSIEQSTITTVREKAKGYNNIMIFLDSNHTHEHVLAELNAYHSLVKSGGVIVVYDTSIEWDKGEYWEGHREWGPGNSPRSAIDAFIALNPEYSIDYSISDKLQITVAPEGFLRKR